MKVREAQPLSREAIHGRSGYNAAERTWRPETLIIGHNEQHVRCALRRHDTRRPPWGRLGGFLLITPPNFGSGGGSCLPVIVVVASGEPGVPVICWANVGSGVDRTPKARTETLTTHRVARMAGLLRRAATPRAPSYLSLMRPRNALI